MEKDVILEVKDLEVSFDTYAGEIKAVRGVSFQLKKGEVLAIVGESGCGKSVTAQTLMRLNPSPPARIKSGSILFDGGIDITKLSDKQMERIRGSEMGMIFQDPMTSLNPTMTIGYQITEGLMKHQKKTKKQALERAVEILRLVGLSNPESRIKQYPHELSGGMRQRAVIAIAFACNPKLLIADEPTTALDVTIQAQIIDLMKSLQEQSGSATILITHDLGVVAEMANRVIVMYAGEIMEQGTVDEIFYQPQHPYTWGLLRSVPRLDTERSSELVPIPGTPPDLFSPPAGCPFAARCSYTMDVCLQHDPGHFSVSSSHSAACWLLHPDAPKVDNGLKGGVFKHG